jgi:hypothetical protein
VDSEYWKVDYLGMGENLEELMKEMSLWGAVEEKLKLLWKGSRD